MYSARGNEIYYIHPVNFTEELFMTVHPTKDCKMHIEDQVRKLATVLNNLDNTSS